MRRWSNSFAMQKSSEMTDEQRCHEVLLGAFSLACLFLVLFGV